MPLDNKIKQISVVGAGQMGGGIAQRIATYGYLVNLIDVDRDALNRSIQNITGNLSGLIKKSKINESQKHDILKRISTSTSIESADKSDLVIEAVFEDINIKKNVFKSLNLICKQDAILASNTSTIPVGLISSDIDRSGNVIGLHFMNPVPKMSFVEVIRTIKTSDETLSASLSFLKSIEMDYIIARDVAGFISSRLLLVMLNEAANMYHQGVGTIEDIDKCCKKCFNHPMGPFELLDFIGNDVVYKSLNIIYKQNGGDYYYPSPAIVSMNESGSYGVKAGAGFYKYNK